MAHHATLSPSSFPALLHCGCYQSKPTEVGGAADKGTQQHATLARWLIAKDIDNADEKLYTTDEYSGIIWAFHKVRELVKGGFYVEEKVSILNGFEEITFGTADVMGIHGDILVDYKSGQQRDYMPQLATYALGMMQRFNTEAVRCIELYGRSQWYNEYTISKEQAEDIINIVKANVDTEKVEPCDYCKWCSKQIQCASVTDRVEAVAAGRPDWKLTQYHTSDISNPIEMAKALELASVLSGWCENVESFAKKMIEGGQTVPGWELKERAGKRSIPDVLAAYDKLDMQANDFLLACSVSLPKLEAAYCAAAGKDLKKTEAKKQLESKLSGLVEVGAPSKSLVRVK